MAAAAAVRSSILLTLRLAKVAPQCRVCPFNRLNICNGAVIAKSSRHFSPPSRELQTSIRESSELHHKHNKSLKNGCEILVLVKLC